MARLRLKMEGRSKQVSMDSFLKVMKEIPELLGDIDRAVSRNRRGTLDWVISDLKTGSAYVEIESQVIRGDEDFAMPVAQYFTDGLYQIATEAVTPPLFSEGSIRRVLRIARNLKAFGNQSLVVSSPDIGVVERGAVLTGEAEPILKKLVSVHHKDIGAVEGMIEAVSLRARRFNVFESVSRKVVKCALPKELEQIVKENLGKTVEVFGTISFNAEGEHLSIEVEHIRALEMETLPSIEEIIGIAPDITGELSTEEFIRVVRGG